MVPSAARSVSSSQRSPHALTQQVEELEGDTRTGQIARWTIWVEFGIGEGNARGQRIAWLVMVGDADLDSTREQALDLLSAGNAAIDGHDEVRLVRHAALNRRIRKRIPLVVAMRDETLCLRTECMKGTHCDGRGRDAVNVEIAENEDSLATLDGSLQAIRDLEHAGDTRGVDPVALEGGRQELAHGSRRIKATRDEDARDERAEIA